MNHPAPMTAPDPATADPAVLSALLARHGWQRHGATAARYARWTPPGTGPGGVSLLVPRDRSFPDSTDLLAEALQALEHSAAPSAREILVGLAVPSDEIRWEQDLPDGTATPAWAAAEQLRGAARSLLLAAVLAVRERAGYHGARHRRQAEAELERVLVGPVSGAGRLTAFVPVPAGRPAVAVLHGALQGVRDAIDYERATGGMETFDAAVQLGVCSELTGALVSLIRGTQGVRISLGWAPATGGPAGLSTRPEPVHFSPGDLETLRIAGRRYRRDEPSIPVRITASVIRMRRDRPNGPGRVRLQILAGAEVTAVRATLDEEAYRIAGQAHLVGLPIRLSGRLESRGGFRRVTGVDGVTPVELEEAERDRMLKSLHENLDFFEEACGG
ncbi:hypothetical protein AB0M28_27305 [Streptomyces sp. NPDC051940]|uniref:hypothetical protein n=1 Tax=Streptomyces sp. NPDC051940 TaxID=3155675 RepID=UPI003416C8EF